MENNKHNLAPVYPKRQHEIFSLNRFLKLLKYDFNNNRFYYIAIIPVVMLAIGLVHWFIWPNNPENYSSTGYKWKVESYLASFLLGYFIFGTVISGKSFPGLKTNSSTILYLSIPASAFEKILAEWIIRVILFTILYPILFQLSANLTLAVYKGVNSEYFSSIVPGVRGIEIDYFSIKEIFANDKFKNSALGINLLIISTLSFFFLTGTVFRKWNIIKGPLLALLLYSSSLFLYLLIFYIVNSDGIRIWDGITNYKHPKIYLFSSEIPLTELVGMFLSICFPIICLIVTYFKIKEKEV